MLISRNIIMMIILPSIIKDREQNDVFMLDVLIENKTRYRCLIKTSRKYEQSW
jgi:hypothetical protein